jgi:hypothetical protein
MIWYNEKVVISDQLDNTEISLLGLYNTPPEIMILLRVTNTNGTKDTPLFYKSLRLSRHEEPSQEEILYKYMAIVNKAHARYKTMKDFKEEMLP